jgi:hypothetical protein
MKLQYGVASVRNRWSQAVSSFAVMLCAAHAVHAQSSDPSTTRLAVLQLDSDAVHDPTARALTDDLRAVFRAREGVKLNVTPISLQQLSAAHDCDSTHNACLNEIATDLEVDVLVFGNLTTESGGEVVHLHRFEVASAEVKSSALATLAQREPPPADVDRKAHELVSDLYELTPARSPFARGRLAAPLQHSTLSGPQADRSLQLTAAGRGISGRKVAGYALLGGAVLSTGLSVFSFVEIDRSQRNDNFERYRRAVGQLRPSARDVCDEAASGQSYGLGSADFAKVKSNCSTGRTFEVLQYVFIGSAVISSGLSAFLLFGAAPQVKVGDAQVTLHPNVGKRGGSVDARFRF